MIFKLWTVDNPSTEFKQYEETTSLRDRNEIALTFEE